ncbi:MAG: HNH endonuclease [Burkholderiaceae bacterium]
MYLQLPFGQLHGRHPLIKQVVSWIGRTPVAVAMKLVNIASLDPDVTANGRTGLTGASAQDRAIWSEFEHNPVAMTQDAAHAFEALAAQHGTLPTIDVIDELPAVIEGKSRTASVLVRVNQVRFRKQVLASYDATCCVSGLRNSQLFIASHIIPWSEDAENRLNPRNGLCLSAVHDRAFDRGLMTVLPDYTIRVSRELLRSDVDAFTAASLARFEGQKIRIPRRFAPSPEFLESHAQRFGFM